MKKTALLITAVTGLALAGCGGGTKIAVSGPPTQAGAVTFTAPTTTTIAKPQTGADMRCTYQGVAAGAKVPTAGHGVSGSADGKSASATLNLTRKSDGSLVVSCTP